MYDTISVKKELPLPQEISHLNIDWKNYDFQTKDLENCMTAYVIQEDGRLLEHIVEREYIPWTEEEKKAKKLKSWNLWKDVIKKSERYEEVPFHGTIAFYAYEKFNSELDFWLDFKAYFIYGKLDKIELVEFKKDKSISISNKEIDEKRIQEQKKPWNVFKHYASYAGWKWLWRNASRWCYALSRMFSSMQMFIIRHML